MTQFELLPEWSPQAAVLLTWPHADTDWQPILSEAELVYAQLARAICQSAKLIVAAPAFLHEHIFTQLDGQGLTVNQFKLYPVNSNDTWARDHGPLSVSDGRSFKIMDFTFNGWGEKYEADLDNQITGTLASQGVFSVPVEASPFVLEGGAIEVDETGALLTTGKCLLNPNRNPTYSRQEIEAVLHKSLGAKKINWLDYGYLAGDDTDSHIDTLARLGPNNALLYVACDDPTDEHFIELNQMQAQLQTFSNAKGQAYRLFALPWPKAIFNQAGERLPATYANFLIVNKTVLVPTYNDVNDAKALEVIGRAFADFVIIGIDCRVLIKQHGSLHCVTMQLPVGVVDGE
ncbi:agmatine deiminase family protein [Gilvimarinus agarilyticus]|uniref:agmatine deiminase family protein n=1 Tax=Gilvimarinus sp. 2_MG-2023 TaxID=3062666 RepID=UPI001C0990A2|nr:agmatine deiminase family protein [Gilvimarinus sp. 2_MG-2023]MBU2887025.1 agmatine deiminase family protein [Gilvimarinus agarilyticus]MDO6571685.1 agmatine deiminase family protein [Gilvimarinus sp. 2_MG-2023]